MVIEYYCKVASLSFLPRVQPTHHKPIRNKVKKHNSSSSLLEQLAKRNPFDSALTKLLLCLTSLPSPQPAFPETFLQRLFLRAIPQLRPPVDLLLSEQSVCHTYRIAVADQGSHQKRQGKGILRYWCGLHGADDCNDVNDCFQWAQV